MQLPAFIEDLMQSMGVHTWVVQVFIVVFLTLVLVFALKRVLRRLQAKLEHTNNPWDDALVAALRKPLSTLVWIVGIAFAIEIIEHESQAAIFAAVDALRDVGIIATIAWFLVRFIRIAEENVVAAAGVNFRLSEKEICRLVSDAGFTPKQRLMDYTLVN